MFTWFPRPTPSPSISSRNRSTTIGVTVFSFRDPRRGTMCTLIELSTCSPRSNPSSSAAGDATASHTLTVNCPSSRRAAATDGAVVFFSASHLRQALDRIVLRGVTGLLALLAERVPKRIEYG